MTPDILRSICKKLPAVTEDIKWGNDLVFSVGGKMFCVSSLEPPFTFSFKVPAEDFDELSNTEGFIPAPYMARASWVMVTGTRSINRKELEVYVARSYELVSAKLTRKLRKEIGLE